MVVPAGRTPVRIARGLYADLQAELSALEEGEICWAEDRNQLYVVEGIGPAAQLQTASVTVTVGSTTQLAHNQPATVTNTGTAAAAVLNFGIPKGKPQTVIASDTPPADNYGAPLVVGDLWLNTATLQLYAWYDDGSSKQWVNTSQVGPKGNPGATGASAGFGTPTVTALAAGAAPTVSSSGPDTAKVFAFGIPKGDPQKVAMSATPPLAPSAGDLWLNTNKGILYAFYNDGTSSQWVSV